MLKMKQKLRRSTTTGSLPTDKERFCTNILWHLNFLAPTFWNWQQNLIPGDFFGANIVGARAAPDWYFN
jgi:hypothetical protein